MASWNRKKRKNRIPKLLCRKRGSWKMAPKAMINRDRISPIPICMQMTTVQEEETVRQPWKKSGCKMATTAMIKRDRISPSPCVPWQSNISPFLVKNFSHCRSTKGEHQSLRLGGLEHYNCRAGRVHQSSTAYRGNKLHKVHLINQCSQCSEQRLRYMKW